MKHLHVRLSWFGDMNLLRIKLSDKRCMFFLCSVNLSQNLLFNDSLYIHKVEKGMDYLTLRVFDGGSSYSKVIAYDIYDILL